MKNLLYLSIISFLILGCGSDDSSNDNFDSPPFTTNGFMINDSLYETNYFFPSGQSGITDPLILAFFSDQPPFNDEVVYFGLFQLISSSLIIGEHEIDSSPVEFIMNTEILDGIQDEEIFVSNVNGSNRNGFIDGRAIIYDANFDEDNKVISIEIAYWINWEDISIKGYFNGNAE